MWADRKSVVIHKSRNIPSLTPNIFRHVVNAEHIQLILLNLDIIY